MSMIPMRRGAPLFVSWGVVVALLMGPLVSGATAQQAGARELTGTITKEGVGLGGVEVTLHHVTQDTSGVLARTTTGAAGDFSFSLPARRDTTGFEVYFATADYLSARYFGRPIHQDELEGDYTIAVYDTSSVAALAEQVRLARRDVVMIPASDGGWEVNEVLRILNPTGVTLVPRSGIATWEFRIPEGVESFQAGEGDVDADDVVLMGDRVLLRQPLIPGSRDLFIRYRIPAASSPSGLALVNPTDTLNLFVRQPSPPVTVTGAATTDIVAVEEERFLQYGAVDLAAGERVTVEWEPTEPPVDPVVAAVVLTVALLGIGAWAAVRNRRAAVPAAPR